MGCFPEQDNTCSANPLQHWLEINRLDRGKLLGGAADAACQRAVQHLKAAIRFRYPAFRADKRHEADICKILRRVFVLGNASDAHKFLQTPIGPNRNNQSTTDLELSFQRLRHVWTTRSNDDGIVWSMLGPPECSIAMQHMDIAEAELGEPRGGFLCERTDALDRIHVRGYLRQNRGGVTRPRTDLQNGLTPMKPQGLRHHRDDIRL